MGLGGSRLQRPSLCSASQLLGPAGEQLSRIKGSDQTLRRRGEMDHHGRGLADNEGGNYLSSPRSALITHADPSWQKGSCSRGWRPLPMLAPSHGERRINCGMRCMPPRTPFPAQPRLPA